MYYYVSIGTNIRPEENAANIIKMLADHFGPILTYPFLYTRPENIATQNQFLNSVAVFFSEHGAKECKAILNSIEIALGRDRSDPDRSIKDRTADIDILGSSHALDVSHFERYDEPYIRNVVTGNHTPANLSSWGLTTTEGPTPVDFDRSTGHVRILDNAIDRFDHGQKPSFVAE